MARSIAPQRPSFADATSNESKCHVAGNTTARDTVSRLENEISPYPENVATTNAWEDRPENGEIAGYPGIVGNPGAAATRPG